MQAADARTDGELLDAFAVRRDTAAFQELVRRHGPMVLRVCQRVLRHPHDAEDAFQATFMVLMRKATTIAKPDLLAGWLHGVACRVALHAKALDSKRRTHEKAMKSTAEPANADADRAGREVRVVLDDELNRLPEKYRLPVVLCYLEGKTNEEAAQQLQWPAGTVKIRLSRARDLLQNRLARRGLTCSGAVLAGLLAAETASAGPVPAALASATATAATLAPAAAAGAISAQAGALADASIKAMTGVKLKLATGLVVTASLVAAGATTAVLLHRSEQDRIVFQNFDGPTPPVKRSGEGFPSYYHKPEENQGGGIFATSINTTDAVAGSSLQMTLTQGRIKARFLPSEEDGVLKFARDYSANPAAWRFNTYNRFRFWFKLPTVSSGHRTDGGCNAFLLTSMQPVKTQQSPADDPWFHHLNIPATGNWTQVIINMHPHNLAGKDLVRELGNLPHPTGEPDHNFFDTLTALYLECRRPPTQYPAVYLLDEMEFYREANLENDQQIYGLTATHVPSANRVVVTWNRHKDEDHVAHEVRYAFRPIHEIGWQKATPAPAGLISPLGKANDNGMVYDSTALPLSGQTMVYIAIKPENAPRFSQVAVPLTLK
jgi:RNA polymerase sigma factor (sigma-70 family)